MLDRASAGWRGIAYTPEDVRLLQTIRQDLGIPLNTQPTPSGSVPRGSVTPAA